MSKILAMCHVGISRSVALADVLKCHFSPVDVIPIGYDETCNSTETRNMLSAWADHIVVMMPHYAQYIHPDYQHKVLICDVGPDNYPGPARAILIDKVWRWVRQNQDILGIKEVK